MLTLREIPIYSRFVLVRTGEKYIKGDYVSGKKASRRFRVIRLKDDEISSLNDQCRVKLILTS